MFINRSTDQKKKKRIDQLWFNHTLELYIAVKKNELKLYVLTWIVTILCKKTPKTELPGGKKNLYHYMSL